MKLADLFPKRAVIYPEELARVAGITRWCIDRDIREGHLRAVKVGSRGRRGIAIDDAERWLLGDTYTPPSNVA